MLEDEKLKEKTSLLMRIYWPEDIFKIGKELEISYFEQFSNWWKIDHYQGALQIAKILNDEDLVRTVSSHTPRYLSLGGFHGKYYTFDESKGLRIEGSWEFIRKNIKRALEEWGEKTYGILKALINKGGKASYFDIIEEIRNVLDYEYIPSFLLPRLKPLGLVFKTGSNKYPDWTIPSEITPIIREELEKYEKTRIKKPIKRTPKELTLEQTTSAQLLKLERELIKTTEQIVNKRRNVNFLFKGKFGSNLLKQNEMAIVDIAKPCSNEEDFNNRIQSLTELINQIEINFLRKKFSLQKKTRGSISVLEAILDKINLKYDRTIIESLRNIFTLRSKKYPIHSDDPRFLDALRYFGFQNFPPDWQELWEVILSSYYEHLHKLEKLLQLQVTK